MCILCTAPERFQHTYVYCTYRERVFFYFLKYFFVYIFLFLRRPQLNLLHLQYTPTIQAEDDPLIFRVFFVFFRCSTALSDGWAVLGNLNVVFRSVLFLLLTYLVPLLLWASPLS